MQNASLLSPEQCCTVVATNGKSSLRLAVRPAEEFTGGDLLLVASGVHGVAQWTCGLTSGAFYAYRTLKIPRQRLLVEEFEGKLRPSEMEVVANCAALAIARLAGKELPGIVEHGWRYAPEIQSRRAAV